MIINFKSKHLIWIALLIFIIGLIIIVKKKTENLPPAHIRDKVTYTEDAGYFLRTGKESRKNIDFASFSINKPLPPTEYEDEMFDFIYAISVFTHLSESEQFAWLKELKRIMKPEAILLISLHGADTQNKLPRKYKKILDEELFVHIKTERTGTFHSINYVYDNYSQYFEILDFIPASLQKSQDIYLLKKV